MSTKVVSVGLGLLFMAVFMMALKKTAGGDWNGRPSDEQMYTAESYLSMPDDSSVTSREVLSKVTFDGRIVKATCTCSVEQSINHFRILAEQLGWREVRDRKTPGGWGVGFCQGRIYYGVEVIGGSPTRIYAGAYWDSRSSSEYYCR